MTSRLDYETKAGSFSPTETYKQFIDLLREAEEDARGLANHARRRNNLQQAKAWTSFANNFNQVCDIVTELATGKAITSVGYTGHG